jgi:hypothetical protein
MLYNPENRSSLRIVMGLCALAISTGLELATARAQDIFEESTTTTTGSAVASVGAGVGSTESEVTSLQPVEVHPGAKPSPTAGSPARPYFIEFRARSAYNYGHTFLVHGRVGQKITARDVVGLHPISESPVPWMIGHVVPVLSETGASDGDYEDVYIIARYRVLLTEAEYRSLVAYLRQRQRSSPIWHAVLYNCSAFVGDVARHMGFKAPLNTLQMPKDYINELKAMNNGRAVMSGQITREAAFAGGVPDGSPNAPKATSLSGGSSSAGSSAPAVSATSSANTPRRNTTRTNATNASRPRPAYATARPQHAAVTAPESTQASSYAAVH